VQRAAAAAAAAAEAVPQARKVRKGIKMNVDAKHKNEKRTTGRTKNNISAIHAFPLIFLFTLPLFGSMASLSI
jgi:hypothetical protein